MKNMAKKTDVKRNRESDKQWTKNNPEKVMLMYYKGNAKKRGLFFDLSFEQFCSLITLPCLYSGHLPAPFNGIDRLNSNGGYTVENCVPCCYPCNRAKSDMSISQWRDYLKQMKKYLTEVN